MKPEEQLDRQLDMLLRERKPAPADDDTAELLAVARMVKGLRAPAAPSPAFAARMEQHQAARPDARRRWWALPAAVALVAGLTLAMLFVPLGSRINVVNAMADAISQLQSYHALIEYRWELKNPDRVEVTTEEVWYQTGDRYYAQLRDGTLLISDGQREWEVRPAEKFAHHGYPVAAELHHFHPASLARNVVNQPYTVEGDDAVAGRPAQRVRVTPQTEGMEYLLWIDKETHLPLKVQQIHDMGTVYTMTYKVFEVNPSIDPARFTFQPPTDYTVFEGGKQVATVDEAAAIAGFRPLVPKDAPRRMIADKDWIQFDYGDAEMTQSKPPNGRKWGILLNPRAGYGWGGGHPVLAMGGRIEWVQDDGLRVHIWGGNRGLDRVQQLARQLLPDLTLPYDSIHPAPKLQVETPPDMKAAMAAQLEHQQNPTAHADRVDLLDVARRFVAEKAGAPVEASAFKVTANTGADAMVEVASGSISRIYLRRVARQDDQGLWWVMGYDQR